MPELGFIVYLLALSYALGKLWYSVIGRPSGDWMRTLSFPLMGIVAVEGLWVPFFLTTPAFFNIHVLEAAVGSLIAVLVDWAIQAWRKAPAA